MKILRPVENAAIGLDGRGAIDAALMSRDASSADAPQRVTSWIQLARSGTWRGHSYGEFTFDAALYAEIVKNFASRNENGEVPLDFEHASEAGSAHGIAASGAPAQGWIKELRYSDDRLEGRVEWVDQQPGMTFVRQGAYKYISPAVAFESVDRVTGKAIGAELTSAALTNRPVLEGMDPVRARAAPAGALMADEIVVPGPPNVASDVEPPEDDAEDDDAADEKTKLAAKKKKAKLDDDVEGGDEGSDNDAAEMAAAQESIEMTAKINAKLSLNESASETATLSAIEALQSESTTLRAQLDASRTDGEALLSALGVKSLTEAAKAIVALSAKAAEFDKVEPELKTLREQKAASDKAEGDREVDFVVKHGARYKLAVSESARKSLLLHRKSDPVDFAETYKAALDGMRANDDPRLFSRIAADGGTLGASPASSAARTGPDAANSAFEAEVDKTIAAGERDGVKLSRNDARAKTTERLFKSL